MIHYLVAQRDRAVSWIWLLRRPTSTWHAKRWTASGRDARRIPEETSNFVLVRRRGLRRRFPAWRVVASRSTDPGRRRRRKADIARRWRSFHRRPRRRAPARRHCLASPSTRYLSPNRRNKSSAFLTAYDTIRYATVD